MPNHCTIFINIALAVTLFQQQRLRWLILETLGNREIVLIIFTTATLEKGHHTDGVKRQYTGN